MKCTMMKQILALLSWGQICIPKEPEAFTFAKMEVGHPVRNRDTYSKSNTFSFEIYFIVSRTSHGNVRALQNLGAY